MSMDDVMNLVNNCLFPIAMCIIMAWYVKYTTDKQQQTIEKLTETIQKNGEESNENINKLCSKIDILLDRQ